MLLALSDLACSPTSRGGLGAMTYVASGILLLGRLYSIIHILLFYIIEYLFAKCNFFFLLFQVHSNIANIYNRQILKLIPTSLTINIKEERPHHPIVPPPLVAHGPDLGLHFDSDRPLLFSARFPHFNHTSNMHIISA